MHRARVATRIILSCIKIKLQARMLNPRARYVLAFPMPRPHSIFALLESSTFSLLVQWRNRITSLSSVPVPRKQLALAQTDRQRFWIGESEAQVRFVVDMILFDSFESSDVLKKKNAAKIFEPS